MDELSILIKSKKDIQKRYKRKIHSKALRLSKKIDILYKDFETVVEKIEDNHTRDLKNYIKKYNSAFRKSLFKASSLLPNLRKDIIKIIADYYAINIENVLSPSRCERRIAECRQVIYFFCWKNKLGTFKDIGTELRRTPSCVFKGISVIEDLLETDNNFKNDFRNMNDRIEELLKNYRNNDIFRN